ncbi:hypothetical protein ENKNEFLB_02837 [Nocardioides aquaticus]|uniref:Uncharacterized protein n=1 Tax=Nocardioides aquaticus TaxID=160826 RepID=A0ABX8EIU2_9ACTN|nr:hypothetical protein [Nocardioides aquaticus]QVT80442.1 hypothetical protein ENKNEFLB_02837 [Nocardioides aquaticus]
MDVTYSASSEAMQREIVKAFDREGYRTSTRMILRNHRWTVRVWRVEPANEQTVIDLIQSTDPQSKPVIPKPSYAFG